MNFFPEPYTICSVMAVRFMAAHRILYYPLFLLLSLFLLTSSSANDVTVKFSSYDYGFLNESLDSYIGMTIEKSGATSKAFPVIIELHPSHGEVDDFLSTSWTVYFLANSAETDSQIVNIFVNDDDLPEDDETFRFQLRVASDDINIADPSFATITIPANDDANGILSIATSSPVTATEIAKQNQAIPLTIQREKGAFDDVFVEYEIKRKTDVENEQEAPPIEDLFPLTGQVVLQDGRDSADFEIFVRDDEIPEDAEHFVLSLTYSDKGKVNDKNNSIEIIVNGNDSPVRFSHSTKRVLERDGKANDIEVHVTRGLDETGSKRIGPDAGEVVVDYKVVANSATPNEDYNVADGAVRFLAGVHNASIKVLIMPDDIPEVAENFTITLLPSTVYGNAIVTSPDHCVITIETNDKANGVLSIDFSDAIMNEKDGDKKVFIADEDDNEKFSGIRIMRHGGSFKTVSIQWTLDSIGESNPSKLMPTLGEIIFESGKTEKLVEFEIAQDALPQESMKYVFRLLASTIKGGAELDGNTEADIYVPDSDNVYGLINIRRGSKIDVDNESNQRNVLLTVERSGGVVGKINVTYSAYYLPPEATQIRDAMPGILENPTGFIVLNDGVDKEEVSLKIGDLAFLQTGASFEIRLETVDLLDRSPSILPKTPRLGDRSSITLLVNEEQANSEVGFADPKQVEVEEPSDDPLIVEIEITREGLSSETRIQLSYRNDAVESKEVTRAVDYQPGPTEVILAPGQRSRILTIKILPDDLPETDEILIIRIDSVEPDNQKLKKDSSEKRIVILENDSPGGIFQFMDGTAEYYEIEENERETVALTVTRTEGDLVTRMVEYNVLPDGSEQFYGVPEIIVFEPGQRTVNISIVPKDDNIPELQQNFTLELKPYGTPASVIANPSKVTVTVKPSDDPHGVFVMAEKDEQKNIPGRKQDILESTLKTNYSCIYIVHREMGSFGEVSVAWKIIPNDTNDVYPTSGVLKFEEGVTEGIIDLWSMPDELPESMEEFSLVLYNGSDGSRVGISNNASFIINSNDNAIFFKGSDSVTIREGEELVLNIRRDGPGSDSTNVRFMTRSRKTSDASIVLYTSDQSQMTSEYTMLQAESNIDFIPIPDPDNPDSGIVRFPPTSLDEFIKVTIPDDLIPEDDEEFFVEIFNATGDYVVYGNTVIQVKILQNDNSSGVLRFATQEPAILKEGVSQEISIQRDYGTYRAIQLGWKIIENIEFGPNMTIADILESSDEVNEFVNNEGIVDFLPDENNKTFIIEALKDNIPEYKEDFVLLLTNVTGGSAILSNDVFSLIKNLSVELNDSPYGKMRIHVDSLKVNVSEDSENETDEEPVSDSDIPVVNKIPQTFANITVERSMGMDGNIKVLWEIYDYKYEESLLPECQDLLLSANITDIESDITLSRSGTGTPTYKFIGGSSAKLHTEDKKFEHLDKFSLSLWMKPDIEKMFTLVSTHDASDMLEIHVPLLSKYDENNNLIYLLLMNLMGTSYDDIQIVEMHFTYRNAVSLEESIILEVNGIGNLFMDIENWKYIVVNVNSSKIEVFLNGELKAFKNADISLSNATEGTIYIGNNYKNSHVNFIGLLQDFRIYSQPLVQEQIQQLYELPAQSDVSPISGVIEYRQDERNKNVIVDAVNDTLTEFNEEFYLVLLDSTNGAVIDSVDKKADIVVLKSDNANGLFGFYKSCQPSRIEEGGSTRCTIERTLGFEGSVTVNWVIESDTKDNENKDDFEQHSGSVIFAPEQKESSFTLNVIEDQKPEISESHHVILQSVSSHDNVISSTSYSGASINKNFKSSTVVIEKGDKAHGIFQFISGPVPQISDRDNIPVNREPLIVHVEEEQPVVSLLIVRAAGWHGEVTVEWRTRDGEAISSESPKDFVSAAGTLTFEDGEGYKFINITLLDDDTPELQKSFYVDMLTPTGGAEVNEASHAEIIISPSDNAYGVYQFNPESLSVIVEEPDSGKNATKLQVKRTGGVLGQTVLKWKVKSDPDGDLDHDSGEVNFNFGQRSSEIEISVLADDVPEFAEHFTVELVEVSHGELSSTGSLLAILTVPANDDPHGIVIFKPGAVNVDEGGINATLAVNRLAGLNGRIRVHYKTVDSTDGNSTLQGIAIPDRDFSVQQSSFLIHENVTTETFTIPILDDDIPETDEDFYVQLTFVELVPSGVVENSPRLGSASETLARVVINENDSPHGVLELSLSSVVVNEEWSDEDKTVVEIVRKFGTFGEITVGVMAVKENAMPDEDFSLINDKVTFLEGEGRKPFPVHIINDINPELEEHFTLQLQPDSVTGDATLGDDTTCRVTIEKSDYPYGYLEISVLQSVVSEPAQGEEGVPVVFTVKRKGGLLGIVAVKWTAFVDGQEQVNVDEDTGSSDYEGIESGESSGEVQSDIDISSGVLYFVSNQDEKTFKIKVMPDDIPENDEIVTVKLDRIMKRSRFNGVINPEKDRTTIKIPANDYPYGMVSLEHDNYDVEELENGEAVLKLKVIRSAGLFGMLRVVYSTEEIDLISEIIDKKENIIAQYFENPSSITSEVASKPKQEVDLTSQSNPLMTCAETCIRQQTCIGFLYSDITTKCAWIPSSETPTGLDLQPEGGGNGDINENENVYMAPAAKFRYYLKDIEKTDLLYDSQARSGMDFEPITGASLLLQEGQTSGNIAVKILRDDTPELDEFFKVHIINVSVIDIDSMETNRPLIVGNKESNIRIKQNDSPHGMFTIHSAVSTPEDNGMIIEAEERPQLSLEMIVERKGGSVGEVTVDWKVHGGSALRDMDFSGDDATLKFNHGEKKKVISLSVIDDNIPELNEDINVELQNPTGGAIISETEGKVHVIILANDNVGGIITFSQISRAVIGNEGDSIQLDVIRSEPAEGSCKVTWKIDNENASDGVNATEGILHFPPKVKTASFWLNLIADNTPEIKEQYTVRLVDVISTGIPQTGKAAIDVQGSVSSITIHGSDDPHGLFKFSETSQVADATEEIEELKLFVSRGFGSVGNVKVYFDVVPGSLSTLNPDIKPAEPFVDFTFQSSGIDQDGRHFILFEDGVTSVPIVFNIIDDDIPEMNEIFHVNLTEVVLLERPKDAINFIPPSIDADYSSSQVVIDANDGTKGMINFHPDFVHFEAIETEGTETNITLTIIREKGTYGKVEFFVFPQNREAIHGEDYQCEPTTITIPDSQDKVYFPITILDDDIPEGDETFEVLIGNPSIGLEIGNSTKSTIKILSNDDAHGKLSFSGEETLYLEEPNNESMTGSKADLVITRNPESGVFGDISVKYRVERNESQSTDTQSVSSDIFPVEGYIVIKDGVYNEVLEISAVTDSVAELDEHFIVTLHDPQGGATLSDKITKHIVIKANDAPYGRFKIVPKGIRSGNSFTEVEEGPGVKILELDIIREQGLLENVFVSVKTRNGTAQPLSQDYAQSPILCAIQTFDASSMSSFHYFTTGSNQFLLVISADRSGPLSTRIGSSGTLRTLTPGVHTTLYKYNGLYTPVQTIETDGASAATSFTTGDKNYLFITNHGRYGRYETMSRLYKISENGSLIVTDEITTKGANDVSHFKHENEDYLIVANSIDNNQISSIDSYVYRLNKLQDKLTLIQTLPTRGASGVRTFNWNNAVYLAIANGRDTEISGNSLVHSAIYKWTQNENEIYSFTNRKSIDVSHSTAVEIIETGNMVYVILSSVGFEGDETKSQEIERVDIYKVAFGGPQHSIILNKHQSLNISNVVSINAQSVDADVFDMFESVEDNLEKIHLLGIASSRESSLYWLNPVSGNFESVSKVGPSKAILPIPVYSKHKNTSLIAIAVDSVNLEEDKARDFINTAVKSGIYYLFKSTAKISEDVDYIPIMSDLVLKFEPGKTTHSFALSVFDDDIPEKEESFFVYLDNSIDTRSEVDSEFGTMEIKILSNDDAHGVIGFAKDSLIKLVEETEDNNTFTLNLLREPAAYGDITIQWEAVGSLSDITPLEGKVTFGDGQTKAGIQMTILADDIPEVEEFVEIFLSEVTESGNERPHLGAKINSSSSSSTIRILPNDSPHGMLRWSATSLRNVIKEPETLSGATQLVTLDLLRQQGQLGDIQVFYKTKIASNLPIKSQAMPGADYIARDDSITLMENITSATIAISIVPDDIPEDIESFYVVLTDVKIIGESMFNSQPATKKHDHQAFAEHSNFLYSSCITGIGPPGAETAEILIDENDHARGFIQFNVTRNSKDAVEAFEMPGTNTSFKLPLIRLFGAFRSVGVEWIAKPMTASGSDFYPHHGSVHFEEGQRNAFIEIFVVDDNDVEFVETFTVQLIGKPGGAKLGGDVSATVNILPNDSPSGMFGFVQTRRSVKESRTANDLEGKVEFDVQRFQGSSEDVTVSWSLERSAFSDITPMLGKLHFSINERMKRIVLRTLPDQILEGDESYAVKLVSATGGAEISPVAGNAIVTIKADQGAAGTISISQSSTSILTAEPTNLYNGSSVVKLERGPGHFGECYVRWQITPADVSTFATTVGGVGFKNLENETQIILQTVDDNIPEISQDFTLRLTSSTGGAIIDPVSNSARITVAASDSPHGTFTFSQPVYYVKEEGGNVTPGVAPTIVTTPHMTTGTATQPHFVSAIASLTLLRNDGHLGEVSVSVSTSDGTATVNEDYYAVSKNIVFSDGEFTKTVDVELLNDLLPEGPEEFFINITDVTLHSHSNNDYTPRGTNNITLDIPPKIGGVSSAVVQITKSDGAEGIIEFPNNLKQIEVKENNGTVQIPIIRLHGHYGEVSVTLKTMDKTAKRSVDYLAPTAGINVIFEDGQKMAYAKITIVDDEEMEMAETFVVVLSGVNGGAELGNHLITEVIIAKSDYPNGRLHFLDGSDTLTVRNPPAGGEGTKRNFILERTGGNMGEINPKWKIVRTGPYYGETTSSTPISDDFASPTSGSFQFSDGEGRQKEILITILSTTEIQEVEEHFAIVLEDTDPAEISETEGNITITVSKKGNPNGILKFSGTPEDIARQKVVREPDSGSLQVVFPVVREQGTLGEVVLHWQAEPGNSEIGADPDTDLKESTGEVTFRDGQSNAEVIVYVQADDTAELLERFSVKLTNVEGGAVLDRNVVTREFTVQPNDNPHGVFSIFSNDQSIIVLPDSSRVIQVNVTRQHGFFGRVVVSFIIEFNNPKGDSSYLDSDTGDLYIPDGSSFATTEIPIQSTAFLAVGDTFTIRLSTVEYMDNDVTIPPKLSDQVQAIVSVTVEAGNPQVGFDPIVSSVYNNTRNAARMTLKRIGLYGDVTVHWVSGYPRNRKTTDFREGQTTPSSDSVTMSDENEKMNVSLTLFPNSVDAESFSAYILRVTSLVAGGAEISKNHEVTEFEPCGVVRFSTASRNVMVTEDSVQVSLTVQRLYGSRYDIDLLYSTTPVTAIPGKDFMPVTNGRIKLKSAQQEGTINIQLIKDNIPEMRKEFIVTITEAIEDLGIYNGLSPRVLHSEAISRVTIKESDDARGILKFEQPEIIVNEKSNDGSNIVVIMVDILRTVGTFGEISVMMSTIGGGEKWQDKYMRDVKGNEQADDSIREYLLSHDGRRATAGEDYEIRQINATFKINQNKIQVPIVILDDDEPEPLESFFVFLHSPTGGAKLGDFRTQNGGRIMKVDIPANDYPNGNVGFASRDGVIIYEDSSSRSLDLVVSRKSAYGNVTIKWRAVTDYTYNIKEGSSNTPERIDLTDQLEKTSGEIFCPKPKLDCIITIKLKDDQIAEFENWFLVEIYQVSAEAKIDSTRRFINVTMADSDHPFGMFQFTLQSRLPVVSKGNKAVGLTIERIGGHRFKSEVHFYTKQLKSIINIARTTLYPAVADVDYVKINGKADFNPGQEEAFINIPLHQDLSSPNPLPQIFQVKLSHVSGNGSINYEYDTANVTIVGKENTKRVWRVYEALQQNLDDGVIQSVLAQLHSLTDEPMDNEQVHIFHGVLNNIIDHAKQRKLPSQIQEAVYDLFCKLLDPNRSDAVLGFTEFGDTFEQFVFSLMTGMDCKPDDSATVAFGKCSHAVLQSARWYPEIINGHKFAGKGRSALDYFEIPTDLLNVQATGVDSPNPTCYDISFIEYSSQTWFDVIGEKGAMSNKIFSVSINGKPIANLVNPVRYRIHTKDSRISPKGAECVLWNEASKRWLSSPETCTVEYDTDTYVECACHHMSVYAARGPTDDLAGYNEATYVACFICAVAAAVTILGHHVCSRHTTFASKLMMHMLFACGLTQLFFVVSTLASETANEDGCAAIAIFLHYFWLAQFTWILVQAFNIWKVLVMSNDNTSQILTIFFIIGWGLPAVIVALHSIIMYALGFTNLPQIYGDVHSNGDMCFIMDAKAGLLAAVAPACISMMVTCTIGLQLYQRDNTWKQYDDLFRGRFNQTEIPLLFWFFFLLSFSWLWGGLHLAYGQMWMLVLFILFNMVQGIYLLIVYGILHNQIVRPIKSPYETDDTAVPVNAYATSTAGSQAPSVTGDVLNRSTQNLVAKGKDQLEWSGSDPNFSRSQIMTRGNMEDSFNQDDSADFDDLMFALKTGTVIEHSPAEHIHVSPIKHTSPLRVINDVIDDDNGSTSSPRHDPSTYPIADTHL